MTAPGFRSSVNGAVSTRARSAAPEADPAGPAAHDPTPSAGPAVHPDRLSLREEIPS